MCRLRAGIKLFLKNAGGKKIKNIAWAMSVGLLVVRFQYGLYVVVHLSKFVTLFRVNVCCVESFYACCQRPRVWPVAVCVLRLYQPRRTFVRGRMLQTRTSTAIGYTRCYHTFFFQFNIFFNFLVNIFFRSMMKVSKLSKE